MSIRLETAYITGVNDGELRWYFNPDHPDAHADAVAEYKRGVAARTCKPGLPVQNEIPPGAFLGYTVSGDAMAFQRPDGAIQFVKPVPGDFTVTRKLQDSWGENEAGEIVQPSRAVPSLSGEFPGLGKWRMYADQTGGPRSWVMFCGPTDYLASFYTHSLNLFRLDSEPVFIGKINWYTLLSALPPREVTGDYVVGPHGVKFQVVDMNLSIFNRRLVIHGNGHPLICINDKSIFIPGGSPLYNSTKNIGQQSWPLRGEG